MVFRIGLMGASSTQENVLLALEALQAALEAEGFSRKDAKVSQSSQRTN
jgi:aspartate aminotransferase-like enzyme